MATTKALLKEAIGTVGAHAALPSTNGITIVPTVTETEKYVQIASGIAPCDGQIEAIATATSDDGNSIESKVVGRYSIPMVTNHLNWGVGTRILVAKGQSYILRAVNVKNISIVLYKSIGGGLNSFINNVVASLSGVRYGLA